MLVAAGSACHAATRWRGRFCLACFPGMMSISMRFLPLPRHFGCIGGLLCMIQSWYGDDTTPLHHAMIILMLTMPGACYVSRQQEPPQGMMREDRDGGHSYPP